MKFSHLTPNLTYAGIFNLATFVMSLIVPIVQFNNWNICSIKSDELVSPLHIHTHVYHTMLVLKELQLV